MVLKFNFVVPLWSTDLTDFLFKFTSHLPQPTLVTVGITHKELAVEWGLCVYVRHAECWGARGPIGRAVGEVFTEAHG